MGQIDSDSIGAGLFAQTMATFVEPEVARRIARGAWIADAPLHRAQVVFFPDERTSIVRLNDEVRADAIAELAAPIEDLRLEIGDDVRIGDVIGWEEITLPPEEWSECGHITMLRHRDGWTVSFDAVYMKGAALQHLDRASQFWRSASECERRGDREAAVDNLWSAAELAATARLLTVPSPDVAKSKKHQILKARFNLAAKHSTVPLSHAKALNRLAAQRGTARYISDGNLMSEVEFLEHLATVGDMISMCRDRVSVNRSHGGT